MDDLDFWKSDYFINTARATAKKRGYNPNNLFLANNGINKLVYVHKKKKLNFGRLGYGDFIYYSSPEFVKTGKFGDDKEKYMKFAKRKRYVFRKSHNAMSDKFDLGKYSKNELALKILW